LELFLPASPDEFPVEIYICYPKERKAAVLKIYGILEKDIYNTFNEKKKRLENQLEQSNQDKSILIAQIEDLTNQRDVALYTAQEQAEFIVNINKDIASELVKDAMDKIEKEQNIDAALMILDNYNLQLAYDSAIEKKNQANKEIQKVILGHQLKINLLLSRFQYQDAIFQYEIIIKIYEENSYADFLIARLYSKMGNLYFNNSKFDEAIKLHEVALNLRIKSDNVTELEYASSYNNIALNGRISKCRIIKIIN